MSSSIMAAIRSSTRLTRPDVDDDVAALGAICFGAQVDHRRVLPELHQLGQPKLRSRASNRAWAQRPLDDLYITMST